MIVANARTTTTDNDDDLFRDLPQLAEDDECDAIRRVVPLVSMQLQPLLRQQQGEPAWKCSAVVVECMSRGSVSHPQLGDGNIGDAIRAIAIEAEVGTADLGLPLLLSRTGVLLVRPAGLAPAWIS